MKTRLSLRSHLENHEVATSDNGSEKEVHRSEPEDTSELRANIDTVSRQTKEITKCCQNALIECVHMLHELEGPPNKSEDKANLGMVVEEQFLEFIFWFVDIMKDLEAERLVRRNSSRAS